jgi:hypothetical protein
MLNQQQATQRRDDKIRHAMNGVTPLWLIHDDYRAPEESFFFDLVYQHSIYGWIQQRFKYDAFNDVLYHFGQSALNEADALAVQDTPPYIEGEVSAAVPNNPQPRQ